MKICYLLIVFGDTGGSLVLYKFMDKLCERGHEVVVVTPTEKVRWAPGYSKTLLERFGPSGDRRSVFRKVAGKIVNPARRAARNFLDARRTSVERQARYLTGVTDGLLRNWEPSDITISTFCSTSYANYALMDRTVPVYHMQHYEEVFMEGEESLKMARLTYFLPLVLVSNCIWLQNQVKTRTGRNSYLLNPGMETGVFYPRADVSGKYDNPSKISVVSYYSPVRFKAWEDSVQAMKIVFDKLPKGKVEWTVFGNVPPVKPDLPVRFVGKVYGDSLAELYSKSHIGFMSSWYESFPLPPLEAMACGTAFVTTRPGSEDYAFDGENALVVPPAKPNLLADRILRLIENPALALRLAQAGVKTASQYTWEKAGENLEKILLEARGHDPGKKFADIPDFIAGRNLPLK